MKLKQNELFNFYSHFSGVLAAVTGSVFLAKTAGSSSSAFVVCMIYSLSVIFLFSASSLYHAFKKKENELSFWRKMDRLAIFFMIAGTYTPVCYFCLDGTWRWSMIGLQWGLVGFGVISQLFFPRAPRVFYAFVYLAMGWSAIFPINQILSNMTQIQQNLLFSGAAAFTAGGIIYAFKIPDFLPKAFGFHGLFHVMVLIGGIFHYTMIYSLFNNYNALTS
ncbi:MAG: hemolysin III family protein [Desulfobacteraceae bacterium]|nr:hemolysin III family protein [Desulfobacteraceae bacterium]MCB9494991.1 hemolysin III family protein [Desulfobacteraceae bacterium]